MNVQNSLENLKKKAISDDELRKKLILTKNNGGIAEFCKIADEYGISISAMDIIEAGEELVRHVHEVLELMNAITKDKRFEEAMKEYEGQRGEVSMSEIALDKIEARG